MFWHSLMISPITLGSISWRLRVMFLNNSRSLGHWLKINVVNLLSVWDLTMVGNMWVYSLRIIWFSQLFHGIGISCRLLSRMALLNKRREPCLKINWKYMKKQVSFVLERNTFFHVFLIHIMVITLKVCRVGTSWSSTESPCFSSMEICTSCYLDLFIIISCVVARWMKN